MSAQEKSNNGGGDDGAAAPGAGPGPGPGPRPRCPLPGHDQCECVCPICLLPFKHPVVTTCGHYYCMECFHQIVRTSTHPRCALCRKNV